MNFLMFGAPMAGKGTLANMLAEERNLPTISMGDILRGSIARGDKEGILAKSYMDKGEMVPNEVVCAMIKNRLAEPDVQNGFILDGFPRTPSQLEVFVNEKVADIDVVVGDLEELVDYIYPDVGSTLEIVGAYLDATFGGARHQTRVDKIMALENK